MKNHESCHSFWWIWQLWGGERLLGGMRTEIAHRPSPDDTLKDKNYQKHSLVYKRVVALEQVEKDCGIRDWPSRPSFSHVGRHRRWPKYMGQHQLFDSPILLVMPFCSAFYPNICSLDAYGTICCDSVPDCRRRIWKRRLNRWAMSTTLMFDKSVTWSALMANCPPVYVSSRGLAANKSTI